MRKNVYKREQIINIVLALVNKMKKLVHLYKVVNGSIIHVFKGNNNIYILEINLVPPTLISKNVLVIMVSLILVIGNLVNVCK